MPFNNIIFELASRTPYIGHKTLGWWWHPLFTLCRLIAEKWFWNTSVTWIGGGGANMLEFCGRHRALNMNDCNEHIEIAIKNFAAPLWLFVLVLLFLSVLVILVWNLMPSPARHRLQRQREHHLWLDKQQQHKLNKFKLLL